MTDNGPKWTWIVAAMIGIGDVAMEVPHAVASSPRKLPDEFTARNLTIFHLEPAEKGGSNVKMASPVLHGLGTIEGLYRIRASTLAYWAMASADAIEKLDKRWTPEPLVKPAGPVEKAILQLPKGK